MLSVKHVFSALLALYALALCTPSQAGVYIIDQPHVFIMEVDQLSDNRIAVMNTDNALGMKDAFQDERMHAPKKLVSLTIGERFQKLPIKSIVENKFQDYIDDIEPNDVAIFYYTGLAFSFPGDPDLHLLTADASSNDYTPEASEVQIDRLLTYSVSVQEIVSRLHDAGTSRVLILLDLPYCLEIGENDEDLEENAPNPRQVYAPINIKTPSNGQCQTIIWTSIGASDSIEVDDVVKIGDHEYSAFTGRILQSLQYRNSPADANHDGRTSFFETVNYVNRTMVKLCENGISLHLFHYGALEDFDLAHGSYKPESERFCDVKDDEVSQIDAKVEVEEDDNDVGIIIEKVNPDDLEDEDDEEYTPIVTVQIISDSDDADATQGEEAADEEEEEDDNGVGIIIEQVNPGEENDAEDDDFVPVARLRKSSVRPLPPRMTNWKGAVILATTSKTK